MRLRKMGRGRSGMRRSLRNWSIFKNWGFWIGIKKFCWRRWERLREKGSRGKCRNSLWELSANNTSNALITLILVSNTAIHSKQRTFSTRVFPRITTSHTTPSLKTISILQTTTILQTTQPLQTAATTTANKAILATLSSSSNTPPPTINTDLHVSPFKLLIDRQNTMSQYTSITITHFPLVTDCSGTVLQYRNPSLYVSSVSFLSRVYRTSPRSGPSPHRTVPYPLQPQLHTVISRMDLIFSTFTRSVWSLRLFSHLWTFTWSAGRLSFCIEKTRTWLFLGDPAYDFSCF